MDRRDKSRYGLGEKAEPRAQPRLVDAILDAVEAPVMVLDGDGRILRFNPACEKATGYTLDEVKGRQFWELLVAPEEREAAAAAFLQRVAVGRPPQGEQAWVTKEGQRRLFSWSGAVVGGERGRPEQIVAVGRDITQREQAALLQRSGESLQRVTMAMLQHITTLDDVLAIVCNEALELTGATGSAVLLLEDGQWLRVTGSAGAPPPSLERLPVGESFAGSVIAQGRPLLLKDPQGEMQAYRRQHDLRTLLAVPLFVDDTIIGALDVVNKPGGFAEGDIRVLQLYADQAAIAIEHAQLHRQAEKLAVIEERQRLARELHDSVTQALYSVMLYADATQMALAAEKEAVAAGHLQALRNMAREAMMDMRLLIFELHPPILEKEGLVTAVQARLETVEERAGLQTALHVGGKEKRLPLAIEEELYRVVQEALNNAVKHARAQRITVEFLYGENCLRMAVRDDGTGFDPQAARKSGGMGLRSIEERVRRTGGELTVESAPDEGTSLSVRITL